MAGAHAQSGSGNSLVLRISSRDDELFVEIIYGKQMADLGKIELPADMMTAEEADLDQLGLALLHKIVHDFHQVNISGITYVWFQD